MNLVAADVRRLKNPGTTDEGNQSLLTSAATGELPAIGAESWLRIAAVAAAAFVAVEIEKWIRFGGRRGERAIPE